MKRKWTYALVSLCLALSVALGLAALPLTARADETPQYYTVDAPLGTVDISDSPLIEKENRAYETYDGKGESPFYGDNAIGATLNKTFTMSFFWDDDNGGTAAIMIRTAGWGDGPQVRIWKDGTVRVGYEKADNKWVDMENKVAFQKDVVYRMEYTPYALYADEDLTNRVGIRLVAHIYNDDKTYDKTVSGDFTDLPADMGIDTGNFILWIPNGAGEVEHQHLASIDYDPTAEKPEPPAEIEYYTKPASTLGTIDFGAVFGLADSTRSTYDSTGEAFREGKGATIGKTLTMTFFWDEGDNGSGSIMLTMGGWSQDFQLRISKDGTVKLGHLRKGEVFTEMENKTAFTSGVVYYLEYTFQYLYTDEACTEIGGVRQTAHIYDADKTYEKTHAVDTAPIPSEANVIADNLRIFINGEMQGQHLASFDYDPHAEEIVLEPMVDLDNIPVIEISKKLPMNAAGLDRETFANSTWPDGHYGHYNTLYEINKTLRFGVQGAGSFRFTLSGTGIWEKYKFELDYANNKVKLDSGDKTPDEALSTEKRYIVELTVVQYRIKGTETIGQETFTAKLYYRDGDREVIVYEETQTFGSILDGDRTYFGVYIGLAETNDLHIYPADFERDYAVTLINGDNENQVAMSYGEDYDIRAYAPEKDYYTFDGWRYYEDGEAKLIASSGIWTVDFTVLEGGVYVGTLTAVYTPLEYDVTYTVTNGVNHADNPDAITVEDGTVTLLAPTCDAGYVFLGWYDNAAFDGDPIESITCTGEAVALFAKIAEGVNITLIYPDGSQKTVGVEKNGQYTFPQITVEGYNAVTGWEVYDGENWTAVDGNTVTPSVDTTYRAVATAISYSITYLTDGGESDENPTTYTVADAVTFAPAVKEGYFFVGWFDGDTQVSGIRKGTTGNMTLSARYVVDTLPATLSVAAQTTVSLPVPAGLPDGSRYTVVVKDSDDNAVTVTANTVTLTDGAYTLTYTVILPAATYTRTVTLNAVTPTLTLDGSYQANYTVGETLTLLAATCNIDGQTVTVTVTKDGQAVAVADGKLTLEVGTYTVTYTTDGAQALTATFTVAPVANSGCNCNSTVASSTLWGSVVVVVLAAIVALLRRKKVSNK